MTPELEIVVARIEALEHQSRRWKALAVASALVALAAIALPFANPVVARGPNAPAGMPSGVVVANRFVLHDPEGRTAGGLEVAADGGMRLVLGRPGGGGAAFLEVRGDGTSDLMLRGADGGTRAAIVGAATTASLTLASAGHAAGLTLQAAEDGGGQVTAVDGEGRPRFRAP